LKTFLCLEVPLSILPTSRFVVLPYGIRYNCHHSKLYRLMEGNTCATQAQVKDVMLETLDGLV